jgi:lambda repressor-like predicted transcriptional regulator
MKIAKPSAPAVALHNSAIARALGSQGVVLANDMNDLQTGQIVLANDSILRTAVPIEELTLFAASYDSMVGNGLVRLRDFLAPPRPTPSRIFRLTTYNENEPWETVDYNKVKRGMLADFSEVRQRTASKSDLQGFNRGLSVILDRDELKDKPEWQQMHTKWLIDLLNRASILETMAIYQAAAINAGTTWDSAANPDLDVRTRILTLANTTGFYPQNVAYGDQAHLKRQNSYESALTAGSLARAGLFTEQELATALGVSQVLINAERYQNTNTTKQEIIGQNVLIFTGLKDAGPMDPSNIVRHVFNGNLGGGEYAVYITDLGVKKVALTVENYELIHTQHTTGIQLLAVS